MSHSITARNYQSLANETTIDFSVGSRAPSARNGGYADSFTGDRISLVHAVIGGNASGKTTALKALAFINWLVIDSFRNDEKTIPVHGFAGHSSSTRKPTELKVVFEMGDRVYEYAIHLNRKRILFESIYERSLTNQRITPKKVLTREWDPKSKQYTVDGQSMNLTEDYWQRSRLGNTSLIAAAARFGNEQAMQFAQYWRKLRSTVDIEDRFMPYRYQAYQAISHYAEDETMKLQAEADIRKYDLGIESIGANGRMLHRYGDKTFEIGVDQESSGTQQFIVLKEMIDDVLVHGGIAVIDELDAFLHPLMTEDIVRKFLDAKINAGCGQLLFSTHAVQTVFDVLDRSQISLAEKDEMGVTKLKRFDSEPRLRPTDNFIKKYFAGAFGGINRIKH